MTTTLRSGRAGVAAVGVLAASAVLVAGGLRTPALAQAARAAFDFEDGVQGFAALSVKNGQIAPDTASTLEQVKTKDDVKAGDGALSYSYKLEAGTVRAISAPVKPEAGTKSLRFWARSNTATMLVLNVIEKDHSRYGASAYLPANEWAPIAINLDELVLAADSKDENEQLDLDQVESLALFDSTNFAVITGDPVLTKAIPNALGDRRLVLDDLQLSTEAVPQSTGAYKSGANQYHIVDNFDSGTIRWTPVRMIGEATPTSFDLFPAGATLQVLDEAAAPSQNKSPIEPGGKGLRFSYKRAELQSYAITCNLEGRKLGAAKKVKLNLRVGQKALVLVEIKEKDGSRYQQNLYPDDNKGWRSLEFPFAILVQADDSKDENNKLDPDQIKEISIIDASAMMMGSAPPGDGLIEVDSIVFHYK